MKVIIAPDSFKGSLAAQEAADTIEKSFKKVFKNLDMVKFPIADGGEGTVDAVCLAVNGTIKNQNVMGPLGENIMAKYGDLGDTAVLEMAAASGLPLVPYDKRNPLNTTSFGTGELILRALDEGYKKIVIGIGGSATNDGGTGAAMALGVKFYDIEDNEIDYMCGRRLKDIQRIDISGLDERLRQTEIEVMCDVINPLTGKNGATYIYGPQKGGRQAELDVLENGMLHYHDKLKALFDRDIGSLPGTGAAGGLGAALVGFCNGKLVRGIDSVLDLMGIDNALKDADIVITGEGQVDFQSACGKVINGIAVKANQAGVPVVVIAGGIGEGIDKVYDLGVKAIVALPNKPMSIEYSMENAKHLLENAVFNLCRTIQIGLDL